MRTIFFYKIKKKHTMFIDCLISDDSCLVSLVCIPFIGVAPIFVLF